MTQKVHVVVVNANGSLGLRSRPRSNEPIVLLQPTFGRNCKGTVLTGVCSHLEGGEVPHLTDRGYSFLPDQGGTPSQVRMEGDGLPWATPIKIGSHVRTGGTHIESQHGGLPWRTLPIQVRSRVMAGEATPDRNSTAAGGIPLAFTQE